MRNSIQVWMDIDTATQSIDELLSLFESNQFFSLNIEDSGGTKYSCFDCYSPTVIDRPLLSNCYLVEIKCNSWIEEICVIDKDKALFSKASIEFPFSEPWFCSCREKAFSVGDLLLTCRTSIVEQFFRFPIKQVRKEKCWFEVQFNTDKNINDFHRVEETLWLFLRYATDIPLPRGIIILRNDSGYPFKYHFMSHPSYCYLTEHANELAYGEIPLRLENLRDDTFMNWFSFSNSHKHAMKMYSRLLGNKELLDERISRFVQIFDSIYPRRKNEELVPRLKSALEQCRITGDCSTTLKSIRVAFSHLNDAEFVDDAIAKSDYMYLEKIIKKLLRRIVDDHIGIRRIE